MIPARVTIGPHRYKVKVARPSDLTVEEYGITDLTTSTITLCPGMSKPQQQVIFLHECLHPVMFNTGWDHKLGNKDEELLIRALAPALLQFIRNNPEVIRWLSK